MFLIGTTMRFRQLFTSSLSVRAKKIKKTQTGNKVPIMYILLYFFCTSHATLLFWPLSPLLFTIKLRSTSEHIKLRFIPSIVSTLFLLVMRKDCRASSVTHFSKIINYQYVCLFLGDSM